MKQNQLIGIFIIIICVITALITINLKSNTTLNRAIDLIELQSKTLIKQNIIINDYRQLTKDQDAVITEYINKER